MTRPFARLSAVCLLLLCFDSCTMWSDKPVKSWTSATGGEHLEHLFWDTVKAKDWKELDKHLSPTFVYVGPSGIHERPEAMKWFEGLQIADISLAELTVHPSGGDVIVVTYLAHWSGTRGGKPLGSSEFRVTSTWERIDKNWVLISRAHTPPA